MENGFILVFQVILVKILQFFQICLHGVYIDIPPDNDFTIPSSGIKINSFTLWGDCIILLYNLEVNNEFIQGIYGQVMSHSQTSLVYKVQLHGDKIIYYNSSYFTSTSVVPNYAIDYYPYTKDCGGDMISYFDSSITNYCGNCNTSVCKKSCTRSSSS